MSYCLADTKKSDGEIYFIYKKYRESYGESLFMLDEIFSIALIDKSRFPNINSAKDEDSYIQQWVSNYVKAMAKLPRYKIAKPKQSCSDPAINHLVKIVSKANDAEINEQEKHHNLFMSAENVLGQLLEEYIASKIQDLGWYWCAGNVLRAIDFCHNEGGFLQIKNKSNSENSSSSAIRENTTIKKWYRLGSRKEKGKLIPVFKWDLLNAIINDCLKDGQTACNMSEEDYRLFLTEVAKSNPNIISGL